MDFRMFFEMTAGEVLQKIQTTRTDWENRIEKEMNVRGGVYSLPFRSGLTCKTRQNNKRNVIVDFFYKNEFAFSGILKAESFISPRFEYQVHRQKLRELKDCEQILSYFQQLEGLRKAKIKTPE